jgi:hypothetical protein
MCRATRAARVADDLLDLDSATARAKAQRTRRKTGLFMRWFSHSHGEGRSVCQARKIFAPFAASRECRFFPAERFRRPRALPPEASFGLQMTDPRSTQPPGSRFPG